MPAGWTASLLGGGNVVDAVTATPDKPGEVRLDVAVPADAAVGHQDDLRSTPPAVARPTRSPVSVRVDAAAAGERLAHDHDPDADRVPPTPSFSFDLAFKNDTPQDVTLSVTGHRAGGLGRDAHR